MGILYLHTCIYIVYFSHICKIYTIVYPICSTVDPDIVPPEVLDMHEDRYQSRFVSRMTVLCWVHKLGFKWADSAKAPFCDRHEDPEIVAYCSDWVKAMVSLKPRL